MSCHITLAIPGRKRRRRAVSAAHAKPEVTAQLQKAFSDYAAAATICTTAVENRNFDDFKQEPPLSRRRTATWTTP
jgi:hypothetical protein